MSPSERGASNALGKGGARKVPHISILSAPLEQAGEPASGPWQRGQSEPLNLVYNLPQWKGEPEWRQEGARLATHFHSLYLCGSMRQEFSRKLPCGSWVNPS